MRSLIYTAKQASKDSNQSRMISGLSREQAVHIPSKIILVGSVLSTLSFIGYSAYSGSKYALRGFADALRSELKPLGAEVSLYFPGNMDTPGKRKRKINDFPLGFEEENKDKPKITKEIEGASTLIGASSAAQSLLGSILKGRYYISNDLLGELARVSVHGGAPRPNLIWEVKIKDSMIFIRRFLHLRCWPLYSVSGLSLWIWTSNLTFQNIIFLIEDFQYLFSNKKRNLKI